MRRAALLNSRQVAHERARGELDAILGDFQSSVPEASPHSKNGASAKLSKLISTFPPETTAGHLRVDHLLEIWGVQGRAAVDGPRALEGPMVGCPE